MVLCLCMNHSLTMAMHNQQNLQYQAIKQDVRQTPVTTCTCAMTRMIYMRSWERRLTWCLVEVTRTGWPELAQGCAASQAPV